MGVEPQFDAGMVNRIGKFKQPFIRQCTGQGRLGTAADFQIHRLIRSIHTDADHLNLPAIILDEFRGQQIAIGDNGDIDSPLVNPINQLLEEIRRHQEGLPTGEIKAFHLNGRCQLIDNHHPILN